MNFARFKRIPAKWLAAVIIIFFCIGGYFVYTKQNEPKAAILPTVKASNKVIAEGKVIPVNYSVLSFSVSGIVSEVLVKEGDKVEAGQVLVRLECQDLKARYSRLAAAVEKASAENSKARFGLRPQEITIKDAKKQQYQAACQKAKDDFERTNQLYKAGAVSQKELDKVTSTYLQAQAELRQAEADLAMGKIGSRDEDVRIAAADLAGAKAELKETQAKINQNELRAPFSGTITSLDLKVGEFVTTETAKIDENAEITDSINVHLADTSKWLIRTHDLSETEITRVKEGAPVTITFPGIPGLELPGRVLRIKGYGEKRHGDMTFAVVVEPLRYDDRMKWNMTAFVAIETEIGSNQ